MFIPILFGPTKITWAPYEQAKGMFEIFRLPKDIRETRMFI